MAGSHPRWWSGWDVAGISSISCRSGCPGRNRAISRWLSSGPGYRFTPILPNQGLQERTGLRQGEMPLGWVAAFWWCGAVVTDDPFISVNCIYSCTSWGKLAASRAADIVTILNTEPSGVPGGGRAEAVAASLRTRAGLPG
jgi:hypothetical protein